MAEAWKPANAGAEEGKHTCKESRVSTYERDNHHRLPLLVSNPSSCVDVSLVYVFSEALTDRPRKCDGSGCSGVFDWTLIADGTRHRV